MANRIPFGPSGKTVFERHGVASGAIRRQDGKFREYSVIFTGSSQLLVPADMTPAQLLGATLENATLPKSEKDRFYTILGGYYFEFLPGGGTRISQLFGVALRPDLGFNLTEGSTQQLSGQWELKNQSDNKVLLLDEKEKGKKNANDPGYFGWSLITDEVKPENLRPMSGKEVKFYLNCPEISGFTHELTATEEATQTVTFEVLTDIEAVDATFTWNWGDGSSPETSQTTSLSHSFLRPDGENQTFEVSVSMHTAAGCDATTNASVLVSKKCPAIKSLVAEPGDTTRTTAAYTFVATLEGASAPESYRWTIGNAPPVTTEGPSLTHVFERGESEETVVTVLLELVGPDPCQSQGSVTVTIPAETPIHLNLTKTYQPADASTQPVLFVLDVEGIEPEEYNWDLGDGTRTTTPDHSLLHAYLRPAGSAQNFTVQVFTEGPDGFISETKITDVQVPGICPELTAVTASPAEGGGENEHAFDFEVTFTGPAPTTFYWNFGNEETVETSTPQTSHTFSSAAGQLSTREITVTASGPDDCQTNQVSTQITLDAACPIVTSIESVAGTLGESELAFSFTALFSGPAPTRFVWTFGDEQAEETTTPTVAHTYQRPGGDLENYPVTLQTFGPGSCQSTLIETEVSVPGICPVITGILVEEGISDENQTSFTFTAQLQGPPATKFTWGFPDGISLETTGPELVHSFAKSPGENSTYLVTVWASGPEHCISNTQSTEVQVAAICPVATDLQANYLELTDTTSEVKFTLIFEGPTPTSFIWDFGNETTETTALPEVTHAFSRAEGVESTFRVKGTSSGPGICRGQELALEVKVPGTCPVLSSLEIAYAAPTDNQQAVDFEAIFTGPTPTSFEWDFGTGEKITTFTPAISHTYPRPSGQDLNLVVKVKTTGPGTCVSAEVTQTITIPKACPQAVSLEAMANPLAELEQSFLFNFTYTGPSPDSFSWNWGDGSEPEISTKPSLSHAFQRQPGDGNSYVVTVDAIGPGSCAATSETTVQVAGLCPEITAIDVVTGRVTDTEQPVTATLQLAHTTASSYQWNWGDGSPVQTTEAPSAVHTYLRKPGDPVSYTLNVSTTGPGSCKAMGVTTVNVLGRCPEVTGLALEVLTPTDKTVPVSATVQTGELVPATFFWNWGDGSAEESSLTSTRQHIYPRIPGDPVTYQVSIRTEGPGSCMGSAEGNVVVPGICPEITGLVPIFGEMTELGQQVTVTLQTSGPAATGFNWNWGDGTEEETTEGVATHFYSRVLGEEKSYRMAVEATGPGSCKSQATLQISVAALCPVIQDIDIQYADIQALNQKITFAIGLRNGDAASYVWDWGDGSSTETSATATAVHTYARQAGDPRQYLVKVRMEGPGPCLSTATVQVRVQGICPEIKELNAALVPSLNEIQQVEFEVVAINTTPDVRYLWNWDDGSVPETTTAATASHAYTRHPGDNRFYTPKVTLLGPQSCECPAATRIEIPGICPKIDAFELVTGSLTDSSYEVTVTLTVSAAAPEQISWNWGDGITEFTTLPQATHVYTRKPGDSKPYTALVQIMGPGKCGDSKEIPVLVPGYCPVIAQVALIELPTELETEYPVSLVATIERAAATTYHWNWGDGDTDVSTTPDYTHVYQRVIGEMKNFTVVVTAEGPDSCKSTATVEVMVLGYCPTVEEVIVTKEEPEETEQEVSVNLQMTPAEATAYTWDWGDGSTPTETTDPYSSHVYTRLPGDPVTYPITIQFSGPGNCTGLESTQVEIPGVCPKVIDLALAYGDQTLENQSVTATLTLALAEAARYEWNWGDGQTSETTSPEASHDYARFPGDTKTYPVSMMLWGPGKCVNSAEVTAEIPGYCPVPTALEVTDNGMLTLMPKTQTVTVQLTTRDANPESYRWDWGDGQVTETSTATASHTYDRPQGDATDFALKATLIGPDSCNSQISTTVNIQGKCPRILSKNSQVTASLDTTEAFAFSLEIEDWDKVRPGSVTFTWSWQDAAGAQSVTTTEPALVITFLRPKNDRSYQVDVAMAGPGICHFQTCFHVFVAGTCPVIEAVETAFCGGDDTSLTVHVQAKFRAHPKPEASPAAYVWEWGDGSPATLTDAPMATHVYLRPSTDMREFTLKVSSKGPGCDCEMSFSRSIQIPGNSPVVVGLRPIYAQASPEVQPVSLLAVVRGPKPQRYEWDFGDGTPILTTAAPSVSHDFARVQDAYLVKVTLKGKAGSSEPWSHQQSFTVHIPLPEPVAAKKKSK